MKNERNVLYSLATVIYFPAPATLSNSTAGRLTPGHLISQILPEQHRTIFRAFGKLTIKGLTEAVQFTTIMNQYGSTITATANMTNGRNIDHQPEPTSWDLLSAERQPN